MSGTLDPATFQARAITMLSSGNGSRAISPGIRLTDRYLNHYELVASTTRPPYAIRRNGVLDAITGGVTAIGIYTGQLYQWTAAGTCYVSDMAGAWTAAADPTKPAPPPPPPPPPGSLYRVSNGRIYAPDGTAFRAKGVNVLYTRPWGSDGGVDITRVTSARLRASLPGLRVVRFACSPLPSVNDATVTNWIDDLTANGVVVVMDPHYSQNAISPTDPACTAFLSGFAARYRTNPLVWGASQNEPHGSGISPMMLGQYNAWRNAGNNSPFMLCPGNPGSEVTTMNPADFAGMTNVCWDVHNYGWALGGGLWPGYLTSLGVFRSRDGVIPLTCLETGDGGGSSAVDGNWQDVFNIALGFDITAWWMVNWTNQWPADLIWDAPFDGSKIHPGYGQMVANAIRSG